MSSQNPKESLSFYDVLALSQNDKLIKIKSWTEEGIVTFKIEDKQKLSTILQDSPQNFLQRCTYDADKNLFTLNIELKKIEYTDKREAKFMKAGEKIESVSIFRNPLLGKGSFATVYYGEVNSTPVAVKELHQVHFEDDTQKAAFDREVQLLMILKHPNIISCFGYSVENNTIFLVMEHMPGGSLYNWIHKQDEDIDIIRILKIAKEIAQGMNYLHTRKPETVLHRDLKSGNIMLDSTFSTKICDFGQSKTIYSVLRSNTITPSIGTVPWTAPEYLDHRRIKERDEKGDVFSFGVILWELCTRKVPWSQFIAPMDITISVISGDRLEIPENSPLKVMIHNCWLHDPKKRPSFAEILEELQYEEQLKQQKIIMPVIEQLEVNYDMRFEQTLNPLLKVDPMGLSVDYIGESNQRCWLFGNQIMNNGIYEWHFAPSYMFTKNSQICPLFGIQSDNKQWIVDVCNCSFNSPVETIKLLYQYNYGDIVGLRYNSRRGELILLVNYQEMTVLDNKLPIVSMKACFTMDYGSLTMVSGTSKDHIHFGQPWVMEYDVFTGYLYHFRIASINKENNATSRIIAGASNCDKDCLLASIYTNRMTKIIFYSPATGKIKIYYWNRKFYYLTELSNSVQWKLGYSCLTSVTNDGTSWVIAFKNSNEIDVYDENLNLLKLQLPSAYRVWATPIGSEYQFLLANTNCDVITACKLQKDNSIQVVQLSLEQDVKISLDNATSCTVSGNIGLFINESQVGISRYVMAGIDWKAKSVYLVQKSTLELASNLVYSITLEDVGYVLLKESQFNFTIILSITKKAFGMEGKGQVMLGLVDDFRKYTYEDMMSSRRLL